MNSQTSRFIAACVFVVYGLQLFFIEKAGKNKNGSLICFWINIPPGYDIVHEYIDTAFYSFGPFTLMTISNCAIIYKLLMAKWQAKRGGTESTSQALSKNATRGTAMLITVSITFIILTGRTAASLVVKGRAHPIERIVINLMQYLNHSIKKFRIVLLGPDSEINYCKSYVAEGTFLEGGNQVLLFLVLLVILNPTMQQWSRQTWATLVLTCNCVTQRKKGCCKWPVM